MKEEKEEEEEEGKSLALQMLTVWFQVAVECRTTAAVIGAVHLVASERAQCAAFSLVWLKKKDYCSDRGPFVQCNPR